MLAAVATGLFILPYFLFSALAGQLADTIDKARLVRWIKGAELAIMGVAMAGFWSLSVPLLLASLFLMGLHSTLFGPVKYSILPQHLDTGEIMGGTGLIEGGTFLAILGGQLLAGVIPSHVAGLALTGLALLGFLASLAVPPAPPAGQGERLDWNLWRGTMAILADARRIRPVWGAILGTSWFFAAGAVLVSEFAPLVSGTLAARQEVATLFLIVFSLAIAAGSVSVNLLLKGEVSARWVPLSALGLAAGLIDLWIATSGFAVGTAGASIAQFLATDGAWHILFDLAVIAFSGGMFIVPLYAFLTTVVEKCEAARTIAANNVVNSGAMLVGSVLAMVLTAWGVSIVDQLLLTGVLCFASAWLGWKLYRAELAAQGEHEHHTFDEMV